MSKTINKTINIAVLGAQDVGKTSFINKWKEDSPTLFTKNNINIFFQENENTFKNMISITFDFVILLYDVSIPETVVCLNDSFQIFQSLGNNFSSLKCFYIANKCDLAVGSKIDPYQRSSFKYLAQLGQFYHSTKTGMRYTPFVDNKIISWNPPKGVFQTTYDCINYNFPDKVEARKLENDYLEKYDNITEEISDFVSTKMVTLTLKIKDLYHENQKLEKQLKDMTEKHKSLINNIKNVVE